MSTLSSEKLSRLISFALRHHPEKLSLTLNAQGAVNLTTFAAALTVNAGILVTVENILAVVASDNKQRFVVADGMIRAAQGHSFPVELGLVSQIPPAILFHGTVAAAVSSIKAEGLKPMKRQFVHLSASQETAVTVGSRRGKPVILQVAASAAQQEGHVFFLSENNVWLVSSVPSKFIT